MYGAWSFPQFVLVATKIFKSLIFGSMLVKESKFVQNSVPSIPTFTKFPKLLLLNPFLNKSDFNFYSYF